ncbi:MAG: glycosyltransferase family 2 protein [Chitinophagales bacterium]|nr:glycosyltransferase family 2 protein [Chitinophagales bacterium]HAE14816.1 glycosyltransferase [Bacteroidota bacterium]MCB9020809.1 glycosyltransferase family 2 protein [Chitinophagales bacterium]MCB9031273.1 glycosyltransferase family 2 protein [Chitinophagales bacterium]HAE35351.1 glycosyltransferase [Bacteroidota bacterium]
MQVSVVIPLFNEEESLPELAEWLGHVLEGKDWEVIFVDDGSKDGSWRVVEQLHRQETRFKGIRFRRNYGKSAALSQGFGMAQGDVVITMDADLQDSPDEIPELMDMISKDGFDLVSGWKKKRYDPVMKTIPSKFFNGVTRMMSGIRLHDFNCGLKAYRREVVKSIEVYGEMHRYIPVIAKAAGFNRIGEKVVEHRARKYGVTKFGWERFVNGFLDLLSIMFVSRFGKRPMHLFGTVGTLSFLTGGVLTIWLIAVKLIRLHNGVPFRQVTDQPLFYVALVAMIVGVQLFVAGFLGELISRSSIDRNKYQVDQILDRP